jgi:hypothetical protein
MTGLAKILETVPPVAFAAAYGSAVFKQAGYAGSSMVDYIFAVENAVEWHAANWQLNGLKHYSMLGTIPSFVMDRVQQVCSDGFLCAACCQL